MLVRPVFLGLLGIPSSSFARSDGSVPPDGAAGDGFDCGQCHAPEGVEDPSFLTLAPPKRRPRLSVRAAKLPLEVGVTTRLHVRVETLEEPEDRVLGFALRTFHGDAERSWRTEGTLSAVDFRTYVRGGSEYVTHRAPLVYDEDGAVSFEVDFTPSDRGTHRLYLVANDADGDGEPFVGPHGTRGDNVWRERFCYHVPGGPLRALDCEGEIREIRDVPPSDTVGHTGDTGSGDGSEPQDTGVEPRDSEPLVDAGQAACGCGVAEGPGGVVWAVGLGVGFALRRRSRKRNRP